MDLSALIFVALAVAWAVYLVPKALKHHDDVARTRSVDRFSHTMRVLARREPVNRRTARLVVTPGQPATAVEVVDVVEVVEVVGTEPVSTRDVLRAQHLAAVRAAKRRLRVVCLILFAHIVVGTLAGLGVVAWPWLAAPAAVLVVWLVACRLMVKRERSASAAPARVSLQVPVDVVETELDRGPVTEEIAAVEPAPAEAAPGGWDPMPVTLPTYVSKEQATPRTVRTIDLDSTGVWTSGRSAADSQLAREAEQADRADRAAQAARKAADEKRASGS